MSVISFDPKRYFWTSKFRLVWVNEEWEHLAIQRYIYENPEYEGGDTVKITSSWNKIARFLELLYNKDLLNKIQKVSLNLWLRTYSNNIESLPSSIYAQKEFAEKIKLKGRFWFVNQEVGIYRSTLEYDSSSLNHL
jgi:hypothetical protein